MCVIVDTNVANTTIGKQSTEAGRKFLEHVSLGSVKLVIGGQKLRKEIKGCSRQFQQWLATALRFGRALEARDEHVDEIENHLKEAGNCASDDEHVVALAKVTGARLIFTNDKDLQRDCTSLLDPSAKIYTTNYERTDFTQHKRSLLLKAICGPST